jgi:hypothetical protein
MRVPVSLYAGKEGRTYLAIYTFFHDIYRAAPPSANDSLHVAHVDYSYDHYRRGIDVYELNSPVPFGDIQVKRVISHVDRERLANADQRFNVKYEIAGSHPHKKEFLDLIRQDIVDFCKKEAKRKTETWIKEVEKITPKVEFRTIHPKFLLMGGKQEYVPSCILEANLDLSYGCIAGMVNGYLDVYAECEECYAIYNHKTFSKYLVGFDKEQLREELRGGCKLNGGKGDELGRKVSILRHGKRTESGSKVTLEQLMIALETCAEEGVRSVMPTRYLKFDKEVARLFIESKSVLQPSIAYDQTARGACSYGCDNEFRIEQAIKFHEAGVQTVPYLMIDLPHPPTERDMYILKEAEKRNMPVQLLPVRIPSKRVAKIVTGMSWEDLKKDMHSRQFKIKGVREEGIQLGGGYKSKDGKLVAQEKDSFWKNLVGNNTGRVRMCHHDDKETYCGGCFVRKGFITKTQPIDIKYKNIRKGNWKKAKKKHGQMSFF